VQERNSRRPHDEMRRRWQTRYWLLLGLLIFGATLIIDLAIRIGPELADQRDFDPPGSCFGGRTGRATHGHAI
jgi:hypothetical protein